MARCWGQAGVRRWTLRPERRHTDPLGASTAVAHVATLGRSLDLAVTDENRTGIGTGEML